MDDRELVKKIPDLERRVTLLEKDRGLITELRLKVAELRLALDSIGKTMCDFIKKHEQDAPKAIKTMKGIISTQILVSIGIVGLITGFIFWQTQRIIKLQDDNIRLRIEAIKDEE